MSRPWGTGAYLRARSTPRLLAGLLVLETLTLLSGNTPLRFPTWSGVSAPVSVAVVIPVLYAVWTATCLHSSMQDLEHSAARPLRYWELGQATGVWLLTMLLLGTTVATVSTPDFVTIALRNTCLWFGVALLSARALGTHRAWLVPLAGSLTVLAFGWDEAAQPHRWAVVLHPAGGTWALACSGLFITVGLAATAATGRHRT